jgi:hypothetical protein
MAKSKIEKLPNTIFVRNEDVINDPDCLTYLIADSALDSLVGDIGNKVLVGEYRLVGTMIAEGVLHTTPVVESAKAPKKVSKKKTSKTE